MKFKEFICKINHGGISSKRFCAVFSLLVLPFCSLLLSLAFSRSAEAYTVDQIIDLGSPGAVDLNDYTNFDYTDFCLQEDDGSSTSCISEDLDIGVYSNHSAAIYKPNSWNYVDDDSVSYRFLVPYQFNYPMWNVPGSGDNHDALKISCTSGKYYYGDSVSFTDVTLTGADNLLDDFNAENSNVYSRFYSNFDGDDSGGTVSNPIYLQDISVYDFSVSDNNTLVSIYEIPSTTGSLYNSTFPSSNYSFTSFYANNSNGTDSTSSTVTFNGAVIGCSETSVASTLASIDSNPTPTPTPTATFPYSYESGDIQNNEEAWDIMQNINPDDYRVDTGDSLSIIALIKGIFQSLLDIDNSMESCSLYMPAFFGDRFSFGNSGGDNSLFYVNFCENSFVYDLWDDNSWIGTTSSQSAFNGQQWLYVGVKGLIWLFCFWILIKILLGYVYWVYSTIDTTFGLTNDMEDF